MRHKISWKYEMKEKNTWLRQQSNLLILFYFILFYTEETCKQNVIVIWMNSKEHIVHRKIMSKHGITSLLSSHLLSSPTSFLQLSFLFLFFLSYDTAIPYISSLSLLSNSSLQCWLTSLSLFEIQISWFFLAQFIVS